MHNTGESTFIEILQYKKEYSEVTGKIKIYEGTQDLNIFPATIEEVQDYFDKSIESIENDIIKKEEELFKLKESHKKAKEFISGEKSKKLTEASFEEISQEKYLKDKETKKQKITELEEF